MTSSSPRPVGKTPKLQQICAQISDMARELGPDAKMPTAIQLRDATGVSMATLNTALGELEKQQIITRRHGVGIFVSPALDQKTIALICDSDFILQSGRSPFYDLLFDAARKRALSHNEQIEFHMSQPHGVVSGNLQRALAEDIRTGRIAGVIGVGLEEYTAKWLAEQGVPFVAFFGPAFGPTDVAVNFDRETLLQMGVRHLAESGCQRIALWHFTNEPLDSAFESRLQAQWPCEAPLYLFSYDGDESVLPQKAGFEAAQHIFSRPRETWPDGLVISNDMATHGALMAFQNLGVCVGQDLTLVTHANKGSMVLMGHNVPLTLLEYDPEETVEAIFSHLERAMRFEIKRFAHVNINPHLRVV